jgi:hypothetical protein
MAGGYKLFSTGEVLTAANVNNYLMNQTVMVFASAAARTTALSGVLAEGMISYRSDAKVLEIYNGTSWITESAFVSPLTTKGDVHTYSTTDARLPVGTTNQTLIVDSTQTTGLKWAASPQSTLSAKGSLVSASAANTLAELTVGSDGQTLVANSAATTGLAWQAPVQQNPVLNSAFQVWQRGTSISTSGGYTADRWQMYTNAAETVSRQATGDTTNLPNIQYCARVQRTAANATTTALALDQCMETVNSIPFAGKTVTFSFYARAGANYSSASSILNGQLIGGTGTDQTILAGYTGQTNVISFTATLTTTWQRFQSTATVSSSFTELGMRTYYVPVGTAGANDYFEITGVQLEVGSVATPFHTFSTTLQGELAACQRYYWRNTVSSTYGIIGQGFTTSTTLVALPLPMQNPMRVVPTAVDYPTITTLRATDLVSGYTASSMILDASSTASCPVLDIGIATATSGRPYFITANNSSTAYIGLSAEL